MALVALGIRELHELLIHREVSATEVVKAFLERIAAVDPHVRPT